MQVPNHTQIPNELIDKWMRELSHAQFKVMIAICRKTIGWHKETDSISVSQIAEMTGVTKKTAIVAIKELERLRLIKTKKQYRKTTDITINYTVSGVTSTPRSVMSTPPKAQTGVMSTPPSGVMSTHTKETLKDNIYTIPSLDQVCDYFEQNGYSRGAGRKMYEYYHTSVEGTKKKYWEDARGNKVKNWKQKARSVWFKDENKDKGSTSVQFLGRVI